MLNQEQTLDYIRKAKLGDNSSKNLLVEHNIPLIKNIISRFKNKGVEYDDLFQIASMGLLKAIYNFDEAFGVKFSTYCVPMVIGELKRYMRDNGAIKVSRSLKILANKINNYIYEYSATHEVPASIEHLSQKFGVPAEDIVIAIDSSRMPVSLFDKVEDEDDSPELIDKISYGDTEEKLVDKIHLTGIIQSLTDREQKIVALRFFRDRTQGEVAKCLGVSQVQISRLENKIINKIRENYLK